MAISTNRQPTTTDLTFDERTMEVTNDEIAAYADGSADEAMQRRVAAAALIDETVRRRIALLRALEPELDSGSLDAGRWGHAPETSPNNTTAEDGEAAEERLRSLRQRMLQSARAVALEAQARRQLAALPGGSGGLWRVAQETWDLLVGSVADAVRPLTTGAQPITLPAFAPLAAGDISHAAGVHREIVATPEGVRIEFHELPGDLPRLRLIVDASGHKAAAPGGAAFNTAFVRLVEGDAFATDTHILVVPLNAAGRGLTDYLLGRGWSSRDERRGQDDPRVLPAPQAACRLAEAVLAHVSDAHAPPSGAL